MKPEKLIDLAKKIGFEIQRIDITQYLINQIEHDVIVEGEQLITIENELFIFEMDIDVEIGLRTSIGEEVPEYYIENAYLLGNRLCNTDLSENIVFDYNPETIIKTIYQ